MAKEKYNSAESEMVETVIETLPPTPPAVVAKRHTRPKPPERNLSFDEYTRFKRISPVLLSGFKAWVGASRNVVYKSKGDWEKAFDQYQNRKLQRG